jgi:ubiquitin-conjugating enzyme E2 J1
METEAKGQLGGLDTNEAERKRYAERSVSWRCTACGKSNGDILKECAEAARAKEAENGEGSSRIEETVPPELKIGFKPDNAESSSEKPAQAAPTSDISIQMEAATYPAARPAQGVPQPTASSASSTSGSSPAMVTQSPQNVPTPTRLTQAPIARPHPQNIPTPTPTPTTETTALQATRLRQTPVSNDENLVWIDRAIAGVVICLVFMVTKVFLGL